MEASTSTSKERIFAQGFTLSGEELRRFCQKEDICDDPIFWEEKIHREFGRHPELLFPDFSPKWSLDSYFQLQEKYDRLVNSAEEYFVTITTKRGRVSFNFFIPDHVLQGISLAVLVADLPITIQLFEDEAEVDLKELASSLILTSGEEITPDDLEDMIEGLSMITLLLSNGSEKFAVTRIDLFTLQGFISAFDWVRDAILATSFRRSSVELGPNWKDYLLAAYLVEDDELVHLELDELI
jgi:hypothetical protein